MKTTAQNAAYDRRLDVYSITYAGGRRVTARMVLGALALLDDEQSAAHVHNVQLLCREGERYSNQCFDVVSGAASHLSRNGINLV